MPRLQCPGAIYHLVTRGDGRRSLFHDDGHYARFTQGLSDEVDRSGIVLAFCWMPNHGHSLSKTPEPNLCRGMQHWLSGYANWYAKRNRRTGHLFQGRYIAFSVEDEGYYWMAEGNDPVLRRRRVRRINPVGVEANNSATPVRYSVTPDEYVGFRSSAAGRAMAAYLCRRYTREQPFENQHESRIPSLTPSLDLFGFDLSKRLVNFELANK